MIRAGLIALALFSSLPAVADPQFSGNDDLAPDRVQSGSVFLTDETRQLQEDNFANPGYLWVDRGKALFASRASRQSCSDCHQEDGERPMKGAATRYPQVDSKTGRLMNLADRINECRVERQSTERFEAESEELLSLTAYVTAESRGMPFAVDIEGEAKPYFEVGRDYFFTRRGQLNLACNQCHDDNWGRLLRGDTISQGHSNAWPGYRLEWQTFGSLHRRLRDCDLGVRAEPYEIGSEIYTSLELYLAWRARNLPLESPGIRR